MQHKTSLLLGCLAAVSTLTFSLPDAAQADSHLLRCPPVAGGANISVVVDPGRIVYNHRLNKSELAQLVRRSRGRTLSAYEQPLGLTVWSSVNRPEYRAQVAQIGPRQFCARIDAVKVNLIIKSMDVYVVREYRRGSCQYSAVIAHEHLHVDVARTVMTEYRGRFEEIVRRVADRLQPIVASTANRAANAVYQRFENEIRPLFQQMVQEMGRRNGTIDTPQSYRDLFKLCDRW